jgi:hypothetical protein
MLGEEYESIRKSSSSHRVFLQKTLRKSLVFKNCTYNKYEKENLCTKK